MSDGGLVELSLATVAGGAAMELFDRELRLVLDNIQDPNTEAEAVREVTLKLQIKPTKDRESAAVLLKVSGKSSGTKPVADLVYMGMRHGKLVAVTKDPSQPDMFDSETGEVIPLRAHPQTTRQETRLHGHDHGCDQSYR